MTKDQAIAELFHRFRYAKRLLEIDHPTCSYCGKPSVGCYAVGGIRKIVLARCEEHWAHVAQLPPTLWRVRWDEIEDASELPQEESADAWRGYQTPAAER